MKKSLCCGTEVITEGRRSGKEHHDYCKKCRRRQDLLDRPKVIKTYRDKEWFSINSLGEFIAEFTEDRKYIRSAWDFLTWLDKRCKPKSPCEKCNKAKNGKCSIHKGKLVP